MPHSRMLDWRFMMSTTNSSGPSAAFSTSRQFHQLPGMPDQPGDVARLAGIDLSPDEFSELRAFDEFLVRHVQPNRIWDVQCRLLWNEWVRTFRRETHGFPNLILEKEFNDVVIDRFGVGIANDDFRGAVYPGLRYVP
jgi:hypothetical protein